MHRLPQPTSPLRSMFSVEHDLVPLGTGERQAPTLRDAISEAKRTIASDKAIHSVNVIAMAANDDLVLVYVGPRGGVRRLWNFTKGRAS